MEWIKKGLIYGPDGSSSWAKHSALQPTPILVNDDTIRMYVGIRDKNGVSRVGYVDLDANNPLKVLRVSEEPILDIGEAGTFDENGVVPCAVVKRNGQFFLYYAGYQLGQKIRFLVFGGLAISGDKGHTFERYSSVPILERTDDELYFRVIHSIFWDGGKWRTWYGGGSIFIKGEKKTLPKYNIRYMESANGIEFPRKGKVVLDVKGEEHRLGRPYVIKDDNKYKMFYGYGSEKIPYKLGYAESLDGDKWTRRDEELGIELSEDGWDSEMMAYPAVIRCRDKTYMFYNGNNYGKDGFGYAVLEE